MLALWRRLHRPLTGSSIGFTAVAVGGVFVLEMLFVASYAGGLHKPEPHGVPVAVVAAPATVQQLQRRLGPEIKLLRRPDEQAARAAIRRRRAYGAYLGKTLVVSEAPSPYTEQVVTAAFRQLAQSRGRQLAVERVNRLPSSDPQGFTPFYLALSLVVGGYLAGIVIALARGASPPTRRLAVLRLGGLVLYSAVSGICAAVLTEPVMGLLHGSLWRLMGIGALLVLGTAAATLALEAVLGLLGTGLAIAAFVVLANPASGGAYPHELLAQPWRAMGPWLPTGAGTQAFRGVLYFGGNGVLVPLSLLAGYAVVGALVVAATTGRHAPAGGGSEVSRGGRAGTSAS